MPVGMGSANPQRICSGPAPWPTLRAMPSSRTDRMAAPLAGLAQLARLAAPYARRLALRLGRLARGLVVGASSQRAAMAAIGLRAMWWAALGLLVLGGPVVLGHEPIPAMWQALAPFVVGLTLCAALRLLSDARHLRFAALGLGALHGAAVVLVWTAFGG